jgi:hypothetical protein
MNKTPAENILYELAKSWSDWEAGNGQPRWEHFKEALAAEVGCDPELFQPKVVRDTNFLVRLNETLMRDGTYPVMICAESADATGDVVGAHLRSHIQSHGREGIIVFAQEKGASPPSFEALRMTALEHSPIAETLGALFPALSLDLVTDHQSIRRALKAVADLQTHYVASAHDPKMRQRKSELDIAANSLANRLNSSPAKPQVVVKANWGLGVPAKVPYLRIFDPIVSPAGHTGIYVCAFVTGDGKSVVISIQQGATGGSAQGFKKKDTEELRASSEQMHAQLLADPKFGPILQTLGAARSVDLSDADGKVGPKAEGYSDADIASITLPTNLLPSDTELVAIVRNFHEMATSLTPIPQMSGANSDPISGTALIASLIHWKEERVVEVLASLEDASPQIVLAGPPGTGKTYVSRLLASQLLGVPGQTHDPRISLVQFHPTYGYEDFVEGLRPVAKDGAIVFDNVPGPIVKLSNDIAEDGLPRVLIIDELNRANIPRVFGELMYLLEYRDQQIDLMLQPSFSLPAQLYIIATMNTADKSTRVMDVALRRRFDFFQLDPDVDVLRSHYSGSNVNEIGEELYDGFSKLNKRLGEDLDKHRLIGHSYFMSDRFDLLDLQARWKRQIEPLLQEYFFERQAQVDSYKIEEFWPSAAS